MLWENKKYPPFVNEDQFGNQVSDQMVVKLRSGYQRIHTAFRIERTDGTKLWIDALSGQELKDVKAWFPLNALENQ